MTTTPPNNAPHVEKAILTFHRKCCVRQAPFSFAARNLNSVGNLVVMGLSWVAYDHFWGTAYEGKIHLSLDAEESIWTPQLETAIDEVVAKIFGHPTG